jgi:hypothetical protein
MVENAARKVGVLTMPHEWSMTVSDYCCHPKPEASVPANSSGRVSARFPVGYQAPEEAPPHGTDVYDPLNVTMFGNVQMLRPGVQRGQTGVLWSGHFLCQSNSK